MIPAFRLEEHHEAFLIWHHAIQRGLIAPAGNILVHIDEHDDLGLPRLHRPLEHLGTELRDIADFTYTELDIGNFIWPAAYLGILSQFHWMRARHSSEVVSRRLFIRTANEARTEFVTRAEDDGVSSPALSCSLINPDSEFEFGAQVILDIDLDYFCSNRYPDLAGRRIEVTEDTWQEFTGNRYHFLRLLPGSKITAAQEDDRYFLYFNQFDAPERTEDEQARQTWEITARLDRVMAFLDRNQVRPSLIMTCRSQHSGYTPVHQCAVIERAVWGRLRERYDCVVTPIEQLLRELGVTPDKNRMFQQ